MMVVMEYSVVRCASTRFTRPQARHHRRHQSWQRQAKRALAGAWTGTDVRASGPAFQGPVAAWGTGYGYVGCTLMLLF